ncbi:MAG: DUF547 domain-containing protein [Myxococcota bacterium]
MREGWILPGTLPARVGCARGGAGRWARLGVASAALLLLWLGAGGAVGAELVDPRDYDALLRRHVNGAWVDYAGLASSVDVLERYLTAAREVELASATPEEQIALWLNAYNAAVLRLVLEHHPVRRVALPGFLHPANSIRQIADAWDDRRLVIDGQRYSLSEVAHDVLRKRYAEPRVIFALCDAARGSPPLRAGAYVGSRLDAQLEQAARSFLEDSQHGFRIDAAHRTVWLSRIFAWYGLDLVRLLGEGTPSGGAGTSSPDSVVLRLVRRYLPPHDVEILDQGGLTVSYLPFDWRLNGR